MASCSVFPLHTCTVCECVCVCVCVVWKHDVYLYCQMNRSIITGHLNEMCPQSVPTRSSQTESASTLTTIKSLMIQKCISTNYFLTLIWWLNTTPSPQTDHRCQFFCNPLPPPCLHTSPIASLPRSPRKPPTRPTTATPRPSERRPPSSGLSCRAPWGPSVPWGAPTSRWTPGGTLKTWPTRRRKDYFPRGRNCWRDSPLWNKKKAYM